MKEPRAFVLIGGRRLGPYTARDLRALLAQGDIDQETECIVEGQPKTLRVRDIFSPRAAPRSDHPGSGKPEDNVFFSYGDGEDEDGEADLHEDDDSIYDDDDFDEGPEELLPPSGPPLPPMSPGLLDPNMILYAGHPSILSFPKTVIFMAASLAAGVVLRGVSSWWLLFALAVCLFGVAFIILRRAMSLYIISPRRVEMVRGLIARSSNEVRIGDIRAINVKKSGIKGWLGVGHVEFASAGSGSVEVIFRNIYAADRVKGLVRRIQDAPGGTFSE